MCVWLVWESLVFDRKRVCFFTKAGLGSCVYVRVYMFLCLRDEEREIDERDFLTHISKPYVCWVEVG